MANTQQQLNKLSSIVAAQEPKLGDMAVFDAMSLSVANAKHLRSLASIALSSWPMTMQFNVEAVKASTERLSLAGKLDYAVCEAVSDKLRLTLAERKPWMARAYNETGELQCEVDGNAITVSEATGNVTIQFI